MVVSLTKGGNVNLSKDNPGLNKIAVGLAWDARSTDGTPFDLDAAAFLLGANGKVLNDNGFIFYNNLKSPEGSVVHTGDNRTGAGEGDDEVINVELSKVPAEIVEIAITITIDQAAERNQNFGQVSNSVVHVFDPANGADLVKFELGEDFSTETAVIVSTLYRKGTEWKFKAVGQGFAGGLKALCGNFGIQI